MLRIATNRWRGPAGLLEGESGARNAAARVVSESETP